jgi:signal transduction histidine kinase
VSGGPPINAFEPLLSARFVALFRAAIVLIFMVAVWADRAQPARHAELGYLLVAAYVLWVIVLAWAAFRDWWIEYCLARPALLIDVAAGVVSLFFTEGAPQDFSTPLAAFLLFTLVEAIFVGGWRLALIVGILFTSGTVLMGLVLSNYGAIVDPMRIARRVGFFLVITALGVWFGGRRTMVSVPGFSVVSEKEPGPPIAGALAYACELVAAKSGIAIWRSSEETKSRLEMLGADTELSWRAASCSVDKLGPLAVSAMLFRVGRDKALRLASDDRALADRAGHILDLELLPEGIDAISIPVRSSGVRAVFILSRLDVVSRDLLPLAQAAAREIGSALDRYELSVRAVEDRVGEVRQSVARDLHDSVAQSLAGASFRVEAARKALSDGIDPADELGAVHEALHSEQRHVRKIIERLRSGRHIRLRHDLVGDLSSLLNDLGEQWGITVVLDPPGQAIEVGASQLHEIRQIAREAVPGPTMRRSWPRPTSPARSPSWSRRRAISPTLARSRSPTSI